MFIDYNRMHHHLKSLGERHLQDGLQVDRLGVFPGSGGTAEIGDSACGSSTFIGDIAVESLGDCATVGIESVKCIAVECLFEGIVSLVTD